MNNQKISAIVPIASWDFDRALLLFRSLKKNFDPDSLDTLFIIFPEKEKMEIALKDLKIPFNTKVFSEKDIVPTDDYSIFSKQKGWYRQQIMKLIIAKHMNTEHYICLDSDVVCFKKTEFSDLVKEGKACVNIESKSYHNRWWVDSLKVLKYSNPETNIGMTSSTNIFITKEVLAIIDHVEKLYNKSFIKALFNWFWVNPKFALRKWTEYKLYWLFIEHNKKTFLYNTECKIWGKSIWKNDDIIQLEESFKNILNPENEGHFVIIQGNTISDDLAIKMAEKYLDV